jgi:CheY-like chemotaxis protein
MHILFVDDTFETRDLFRLCFTLEGHTVTTAHNGLEAIQIIAQSTTDQGSSTLDVIIMDFHMPQMTGLEVVQQLRQREGMACPPIILFTGDTKLDIENQAQELGVARITYKPMLPSQLIALALEVARPT